MTSEERFRASLEAARLGEVLVAEWFQSRGFGVVPVYERSGRYDDKAPRLMFSGKGFVLPDLDVMRAGKRWWCEVKTYLAPAFNRTLGCDVHGIRRSHYEDYLSTEAESGCLVVLAVLELSTGYLLMRQLSLLSMTGCLCSGCRAGAQCVANGVGRQVYWPRADMKLATTFEASLMRPIRDVWPTCRN